jgi:hypothetical protein
MRVAQIVAAPSSKWALNAVNRKIEEFTRNIADALGDLGLRVLLIDADPKYNLTSFHLEERPLNRVTLLDSDFFITPVAADLFSLRALQSESGEIADW